MSTNRATKDLTGLRFGRLVVVGKADSVVEPKGGGKFGMRAMWLCKCDCGNEAVVRQNSLWRTTRSCGCLQIELARARATTHGQTSRSRVGGEGAEYRSWRGIKHRCDNPNSNVFAHYGGRGIRLCQRWRDFASFYADMGPKPSPKHTIDRIDNNRGYECGNCEDCRSRGAVRNCRWATMREQAHNRRTSLIVEFRGERLPMAELARREGVNYHGLYDAVRRGVALEKAIESLLRHKQAKAKKSGEKISRHSPPDAKPLEPAHPEPQPAAVSR